MSDNQILDPIDIIIAACFIVVLGVVGIGIAIGAIP